MRFRMCTCFCNGEHITDIRPLQTRWRPMHVVPLPHLEGHFGGCLWRGVAALLMHSQAPACIIQVERSGSLIHYAPEPPQRQLAIHCIYADHPPA